VQRLESETNKKKCVSFSSHVNELCEPTGSEGQDMKKQNENEKKKQQKSFYLLLQLQTERRKSFDQEDHKRDTRASLSWLLSRDRRGWKGIGGLWQLQRWRGMEERWMEGW